MLSETNKTTEKCSTNYAHIWTYHLYFEHLFRTLCCSVSLLIAFAAAHTMLCRKHIHTMAHRNSHTKCSRKAIFFMHVVYSPFPCRCIVCLFLFRISYLICKRFVVLLLLILFAFLFSFSFNQHSVAIAFCVYRSCCLLYIVIKFLTKYLQLILWMQNNVNLRQIIYGKHFIWHLFFFLLAVAYFCVW